MHIFSWSYFQVLFTVIHSCVRILPRKSKTDGAIRRNILSMDPVLGSFPFYMRTVQSQTGNLSVGSATDTKSDCSEFVFRPVPCKRIKRNVWRAIRTHTGLSSSRSHVITPYFMYLKVTMITSTHNLSLSPLRCKCHIQTNFLKSFFIGGG